MKKTTILFAAALVLTAAAQPIGNRLHKLIPNTTEDLTQPEKDLPAEIHIIDIDSVTFDVDNQLFQIYTNPKSGEQKLNYDLSKMTGFKFTYLSDGVLPSPSIAGEIIAPNSASIKWANIDDAYGYQIAYGTPNDPANYGDINYISDRRDTIVKAENHEIELMHLDYDTEYAFFVRALSPKGEGFHSEWSHRAKLCSPISDYFHLRTNKREIIPGILKLKGYDSDNITLSINTEFNPDNYTIDADSLKKLFEIVDNHFVVDKIVYECISTGESKEITIGEAEIKAGEVTIPGISIGESYSITAFNSHTPWACEAAYNTVTVEVTPVAYDTWKELQFKSYSALTQQLYTSFDYLLSSEGGTDLWQASKNGDGYRSDLNYETFSTNNNSTNKLWMQCYSMVANCNTVLNLANLVTDADKDDMKVLIAETKVLRAYYNFRLVSTFGPVTLSDEVNSKNSTETKRIEKRTSEKVFYEHIFKDLTEAVKDLNTTPLYEERGRVTKKTVLGLLARAYAQRAGLTKYGDSTTYWKLAAETAEDLIDNAESYGAHLYTDIADMWADANNRTNREALFIAPGADANSEKESTSPYKGTNKLLAYTCGGLHTDLFKHNPTKNGQCYFYGRYNAQVWMPSYYLMYCFNPEWDRRWEYSFIYAYGDYSMVQCGWAAYNTGQRVLTYNLCEQYGIDTSHAGEIIYPLADCDGTASKYGGNQYPAKIWPKGETSGDASKLLSIPSSSSEIGRPGYFGATKAYAMPYPVANDDNRVNTVFVHDRPSAEDLASRRYMTIVLSDLYDPTTKIVYGNVANGSSATYAPNIGNGQISAGVCPSLAKYNWSFNGCFNTNLQQKSGDMFIMRMAEVYLLAAEAEQMLGNDQKAAGYLNVLRQRAVRPGAPESTWKLSTATEDDIFDEYARELCGEYARWALLKRHNAFETRLAKHNPRAAKAFKPYMYNRPVSSDFLSTLLNPDEYGDNGYGVTPTSGLENIED